MSAQPSNNVADNSPSMTRQQWLDRLVDGELSSSDRGVLLRQLDASSDGWRACAMAFLEAQQWSQTFRSPLQTATACAIPSNGHASDASPQTLLDRSSAAPSPNALQPAAKPAIAVRSVHAHPSPLGGPSDTAARPWCLMASMAASALIAFFLGYAAQGQWVRGQTSRPGSAQVTSRQASDTVVEPVDRERLANRNASAFGAWASSLPSQDANGQGSDRTSNHVAQDNQVPITLVGDRRLPVLSADSWRIQGSDKLDELEKELRDEPVGIDRQRGWLPLRLEDGSITFVPIEQFRVQPRLTQ
jgi:hypothetical protein